MKEQIISLSSDVDLACEEISDRISLFTESYRTEMPPKISTEYDGGIGPFECHGVRHFDKGSSFPVCEGNEYGPEELRFDVSSFSERDMEEIGYAIYDIAGDSLIQFQHEENDGRHFSLDLILGIQKKVEGGIMILGIEWKQWPGPQAIAA